MESVTVFLGGDVMTGRGIDQVLPHPSEPRIREPHVDDARAYVRLAEEANGPIPRPAEFPYIWGDALEELARIAPAARIVNLETSITRGNDHWPGKGIHYRMHPDNVQCLNAAGIDVCTLANNHVLDYGHGGLRETLETLARAGVKIAGAGHNLVEARAPAIVEVAADSRLLVFGCADETSGVPSAWAATDDRGGIDLLPDLSASTARGLLERIGRVKRSRDLVVASIHWGSNWGYEVPPAQRRFARWLLDGGVDLVHGHSSHHVRPIEIYRERLILYGCGDLLDDYEGIAGHEEFHDDLTIMLFPTVEPGTGRLASLRLTPMQIRRFRLSRPTAADARWLSRTLDRLSRPFGARVEPGEDDSFVVRAG